MNPITTLKSKLKQTKTKRQQWTCTCGQTIPKKGATLSGNKIYRYGLHMHCPACGRIIAQFVDPKETR